MTIDTPRRDFAKDIAGKHVDRRTLIKAGAWAAPVVVLTTAAPAMAASTEAVPAAQLTVTAAALTNSGIGGALGPLAWAGGTISWSRLTPGQPTTASVSYTVAIVGPGGSTTLVTSSTNIVNGGSFTVPAIPVLGTAPMTPGLYTITVTAFGSDGTKSASSNVTLVAVPVPVPAADLTVVSNGLTGAPFGPLTWAGATIGWPSNAAGEPSIAAVTYTAVLTGPGGLSIPLTSGSASITKNGTFTIPAAAAQGTAPMTPGLYTVTVTASSIGSKTGTSTVTVTSPPPTAVAATATTVGASGNKHNVTVTLTGIVGTVVSIGTTPTNVTLSAPYPTSISIPLGGVYTVVREVNATGQTPGTIAFAFSGSNVVVTPSTITKAIPVKSKVGELTP